MRFWPKDLAFFWMSFILTLLGLITLYSVSSVQALDLYGDSLFFLRKQILFAMLGLFLMIFISHIKPEKIINFAPYLVGATFLLLLLIMIPGLGSSTKGGTRWLVLGPLRFQPSEFAKIALIVFFAHRLTRSRQVFESWREELLGPAAVLGAFLLLFLLQPDFGNTVILFSVVLCLCLLAGAPWKYLIGLSTFAAVSFGLLAVMQPYRVQRILAFMDPWKDPQNTSYQIIQSFIAFYRGGFWGVGLGNSQSKLYFLPEVKTDFIASILAEEVGLIGFGLLLFLYGILILRGFKIAEKATQNSHYLLAAGATLLLAFQALLNLAVVLSLLPTKGLPLPFVSMGGSSLVSSLVLCGLIQSVAGSISEQARA